MPRDYQYRVDILHSLERSIGSTPLYEVCCGKHRLRGCRIFVKAEYCNPTGSHYDRVYLELFRERLMQLSRMQLDCLIEVTSGNAGASFAWFCNQLGFNCKVFVPSGTSRGIVEHIRAQNPEADVIMSRYAGSYVKGALDEMLRLRKPGWHLMNHSRKPATVRATAKIADESLQQLASAGINQLHWFIPACGNGATVVGPTPRLKAMYPALQVVAFETTRAPVGFNVKYPQSTPGQCQPHRLLGTGAWGIDFPFLTDARYGFTRLVTDVLLVSDQALDEAEKLRFRLGSSVGLTSLTALYTALKMISDQQLTDQHFLLIFYDRGEKYDWIAWEAVHE